MIVHYIAYISFLLRCNGHRKKLSVKEGSCWRKPCNLQRNNMSEKQVFKNLYNLKYHLKTRLPTGSSSKTRYKMTLPSLSKTSCHFVANRSNENVAISNNENMRKNMSVIYTLPYWLFQRILKIVAIEQLI